MADVTVTIRDNGPYLVKGPLTIVDPDGNPLVIEREVFALCRCGSSNNKPFCDGTHAKIGFQASTRAAKSE